MIETHKDRAIISLSGPDRKKLLQGIITNNVEHLKNGNGVYASLLTAQGKFLHDFFLTEIEDTIYLDCEAARLADLFRKLLMYRLRSNVEIIDQSKKYAIVTSEQPMPNFDICFQDPRHPSLGYRAIIEDTSLNTSSDEYHVRRIKLGIPEGSHDFIVEKSTILEGHLDQLSGVDFEKGCYVGQEVTARMHYRGKVKKAMLPVTLSGPAPEFGTTITDEKGNKIGDLRSRCGKNAIALFRLQNMEYDKEYTCGDINVTPFKPDWLKDSNAE